MFPRCECYWFHLGKGLETQQNVATLFYFRPSNLLYVLLVQNPVRRRAQSAGPGGGAQVLWGSPGMAWAGGASIVPAGRALPAAGGQEGPPPLSSRLFSTRLRNGGSCGGGGSNRHRSGGGGEEEGGGVCARLAFPPPGLGERGGGEGRAAAGMSRLGPRGPERGTRCPLPPHYAL